MNVPFSILVGKTLTHIHVSPDNDYIQFICNDRTQYKMLHHQDCCESVYVEDINGDLNDLLNTPILRATEDSINNGDKDLKPELFNESHGDSITYTFYHLATIKGYVTIRWYGTSNGYYSESVDFEQV